jgi:transposase
MVLEEVPMAMVGGLDLHRKQITFDVLDTDTGEVRRGRISPADRQLFRGWLAGLAGKQVELAVEGCTGWRFVIEECRAAGVVAHLAEPAEVAGLRGRRRHAKTDRIDARHLRDLLLDGRLPECWIPPQLVLETRAKVRLYKDLADQRTGWQQRMHATLYHLGAPAQRDLLAGDRDRLARIEGLSPAARQAITVALSMIEALDAQIEPLRAELIGFARRQPGCRALAAEYGIGALTSVVIWSEIGDARRFTHSRDAVRHAGLDITVYSSDGNAHPGGCPAKAHRCCAGRCTRPAAAPPARPAPTTATTARSPTGSAGNAPRCPWPASWPAAATTACAPSASTPSRRRRLGPDRPPIGGRGGQPTRSASCPPSLMRHGAARSEEGTAASPGWTASKDRAARPPTRGTPHRSSCRRTIKVRGPR